MIKQFHSWVFILRKQNTHTHTHTHTLIRKDICTPMLTAVLFTIAMIWKQPKCPLMDEWIKKTCIYPHTMEYYSAIKKKSCHCDNVDDLEGIRLSEISQTEKGKYCILLIHAIYKTNEQKTRKEKQSYSYRE